MAESFGSHRAQQRASRATVAVLGTMRIRPPASGAASGCVASSEPSAKLNLTSEQGARIRAAMSAASGLQCLIGAASQLLDSQAERKRRGSITCSVKGIEQSLRQVNPRVGTPPG